MYIYMQYIQNIQKHYSTCFPYEVFFHRTLKGRFRSTGSRLPQILGALWDSGPWVPSVTDPIDIQLAITHCYNGIYSSSMALGRPWLRTGSDYQNEPPPPPPQFVELN
jgi:hypothetical protein